MGQLLFTERGRVMLGENEEVTRWRWAQKSLTLPRNVRCRSGDLWLLLRHSYVHEQPLLLDLNGEHYRRLVPDPKLVGVWGWRRVRIPLSEGSKGLLTLTLRTNAMGMGAWGLAMESGIHSPKSRLSTDHGVSWRNANMGVRGTLTGEYVIRLRLPGETSLSPPPMTYENPAHPRVREARQLVPTGIRRLRDPWEQILALRSWVASRWEHQPRGRYYTPWDPWAILSRAQTTIDTDSIAMCVHFGATFAALAAALGHTARCVAVTPELNSHHGHFMTEVWDRRRDKWVLHDANYDLHYEQEHPLAAIELAKLAILGRDTLRGLERLGPATPRKPRRVVQFLREQLLTGRGFMNTGFWTRNDFVSRPGVAPAAHGSVAYCETDFTWYTGGRDATTDLGMFPYHVADADYFTAPPPVN